MVFDMFTVHCPRHGSEVLLPEQRISALENDGDRLTVRWMCWCGHQGSHRTGRSRPTSRSSERRQAALWPWRSPRPGHQTPVGIADRAPR